MGTAGASTRGAWWRGLADRSALLRAGDAPARNRVGGRAAPAAFAFDSPRRTWSPATPTRGPAPRTCSRTTPLPGLTRRVSVDSGACSRQGQRTPSHTSAVSADGRYVAFRLQRLEPGGRRHQRRPRRVRARPPDRHHRRGSASLRRRPGQRLQRSGRRSAPTAATSPSTPTRRTWSPATPTAPPTSSCTTAPTGATARVSVASGGAQANAAAASSRRSAPTAATSPSTRSASNLVAGDTNGTRATSSCTTAPTGTTDRVSVAAGGTQAN